MRKWKETSNAFLIIFASTKNPRFLSCFSLLDNTFMYICHSQVILNVSILFCTCLSRLHIVFSTLLTLFSFLVWYTFYFPGCDFYSVAHSGLLTIRGHLQFLVIPTRQGMSKIQGDLICVVKAKFLTSHNLNGITLLLAYILPEYASLMNI